MPANVLLSPLQPLLLLVGTLAALAGMFSQQVVAWLSAPLGWLLDMVVQVAIATSAAPENTLEVQRWLRTVALLPYAVVLSVWLQRRAGMRRPVTAFSGKQGVLAGCALMIVWGGAWWACCRPDGLLHVRLARDSSMVELVTPDGGGVTLDLSEASTAAPGANAALEPARRPWNTSTVHAAAMAPGQRLSLGEISLTRLPGREPRLSLAYRGFRLLLPPGVEAVEVPALLQNGGDLGSDLLVAPLQAVEPDWRVLDYACDPQLVVDWSPSVQKAMPAHYPVAVVDPDAELEIATGGSGFSLRTRWQGEGR